MEEFEYTVNRIQNYTDMILRAPKHYRATEERLVREMQEASKNSTELGYLII